MPRVVEVKVAVKDYEATASAIYDLTDSMGTIYRQEDTVFVAPAGGQLWLGSVDGSPCGDLVFQKNFGTKQPMESEYYITSITDKESFKKVMAEALGIKGVVKRKRRLYEYGGAKVWLDDVLGLGHFLMIEYDLPPPQDYPEGVKFVSDLTAKLSLKDTDFLTETYVDMMHHARSNVEEI